MNEKNDCYFLFCHVKIRMDWMDRTAVTLTGFESGLRKPNLCRHGLAQMEAIKARVVMMACNGR